MWLDPPFLDGDDFATMTIQRSDISVETAPIIL